jgi:type II secretory pathway pseudopilin PulG
VPAGAGFLLALLLAAALLAQAYRAGREAAALERSLRSVEQEIRWYRTENARMERLRNLGGTDRDGAD